MDRRRVFDLGNLVSLRTRTVRSLRSLQFAFELRRRRGERRHDDVADPPARGAPELKTAEARRGFALRAPRFVRVRHVRGFVRHRFVPVRSRVRRADVPVEARGVRAVPARHRQETDALQRIHGRREGLVVVVARVVCFVCFAFRRTKGSVSFHRLMERLFCFFFPPLREGAAGARRKRPLPPGQPAQLPGVPARLVVAAQRALGNGVPGKASRSRSRSRSRRVFHGFGGASIGDVRFEIVVVVRFESSTHPNGVVVPLLVGRPVVVLALAQSVGERLLPRRHRRQHRRLPCLREARALFSFGKSVGRRRVVRVDAVDAVPFF